MWNRYVLWRQYDPARTGFLDTWLFIVFMIVLGWNFTHEDPNSVLVVGLLAGLLLSLPMGGLYYACLGGEWLKECPYKESTLKAWKRYGEDQVAWLDKKAVTWEDIEKCVRTMRECSPRIPARVAYMAVIHGVEELCGHEWVPKEADRYRKRYPKAWFVIRFV